MSLEDRLRDGLEGLDAIEGSPEDRVVQEVLGRGRRRRWGRRMAAGAVALAAAVAALVWTPKTLDALREGGDQRPARPAEPRGIITTVAGTGAAGMSGNGGPATEADVNYPVDLGFDAEGNLYILELGFGNLGYGVRVRRVDAEGRITTVAGPGATGRAGRHVMAARLVLGTTYGSTGLAVDAEGNVYIGGGDGPDIDNRVIRVDPSGRFTTIAGTGEDGYSGDGGPATEAELSEVWDVAVDASGNVYITDKHRIRKVDPIGIITTIVGNAGKGFSGDGGPATEARTGRITGVAVGPAGEIVFIDYGNGRIRRIDADGIITTIAGSGPDRPCFSGDGGPATGAHLCGPEHLWVDAEGNVFVADTYNDRIRMIGLDGIITTVAGDGVKAYSGDGGPALEASLSEPSGVAVGPDGAIYITDSANKRVRRVLL